MPEVHIRFGQPEDGHEPSPAFWENGGVEAFRDGVATASLDELSFRGHDLRGDPANNIAVFVHRAGGPGTAGAAERGLDLNAVGASILINAEHFFWRTRRRDRIASKIGQRVTQLWADLGEDMGPKSTFVSLKMGGKTAWATSDDPEGSLNDRPFRRMRRAVARGLGRLGSRGNES